MAKIRDDIIASVSRFHGVTMAQLSGLSRAPEIVAARADAAQRLKIAGFHAARIGRILKRDPSVISDYLKGHYCGGKKDKRLTSISLSKLPRDVCDVVAETARLSQTTPEIIVAELVCERAMYEVTAKCEDNRGHGKPARANEGMGAA